MFRAPPTIDPSKAGRSTVNTFSGSFLSSHFGLVFLTFCPVAVAAEGSVPLGTRTSATCVQTSLESVGQDPSLIFIAVPL